MAAWVWEGGEPGACPLAALQSARGDTVTQLAEGWSLPASAVLCRWMRWCSLRVVHLWACPPVVQRYLEHGEAHLRRDAGEAANRVAWDAALAATRQAAWSAEWATHTEAPAEAAWNAAWAAARAEGWQAAKPKSKVRARHVARTSARDEAQELQAAHLTTLLRADHQLQRLEPRFRALRQGDRDDQAVLRDIALQRGMPELAHLLVSDPGA